MKLLSIAKVVDKFGLSLNVEKNVYFSYRMELSKKSIQYLKNSQRMVPLTMGIDT
jgi:hypothetical protein